MVIQGGGKGGMASFPGPGSHPAFHCLQYEICSKIELGLRKLAKHIHVHVCMIRVWRDGLIRVRLGYRYKPATSTWYTAGTHLGC